MRFINALKQAEKHNRNIVIPDIKCRSPKEGDLLKGRNAQEIAKALIQAGAPVLSVVTEPREFGGSLELLESIAAMGLPVLRKDFINTKEELLETKALGASAVLLMYSCLGSETLGELYCEAKRIGLDVLVETHTADELKQAGQLGAELVGINNRDIRVLERDEGTVRLTEQLVSFKPKDTFLISESSLQTADDVRAAIGAGADAALVGTSLLRAENIQDFYKKLCRKTRVKLCGMMSEENIRMSRRADILGFVVDYPEDVPWNLSVAQCERLLAEVPKECKTCVVTGGIPEKVIPLAERLRPDYIQLHHRETLEQTKEIVSELRKQAILVIRSIPASEQARKSQFGISDLAALSRELAGIGITELLIDGREASNAAGTHAAGIHMAAPLEAFKQLRACSPLPVMLAGGIGPDNLVRTLCESGAENIDIMTGIETSPGRKSERAIRKLFRQIEG